MPLVPQASKVIPVATVRAGKVHVEYEIYDTPGQPNRLEFRRGQRYLLELFDGAGEVCETLPALIELALDPPPSSASTEALGGMEKFLCFFFGRGASWYGDARDLPERAKTISGMGVRATRESSWRVLRLRGWGAPKILLLNRTGVGGSSPMGSQKTTTFHPFSLTLDEARALRDGLIAISPKLPVR